MKHRVFLTVLLILWVTSLLSRSEPNIQLLDLKCFPKLMKHGIVHQGWFLDSLEILLVNECPSYRTSISLNIVGDTLIISAKERVYAKDSKFVGIKATLQSDSTAIAYLHTEDVLKGKSSRRLRKDRQKHPKPLGFQIVVTNDSKTVVTLLPQGEP